MQLKNLSLICGALALSLTATCFAVKVEANSSLPSVIAQSQDKKGPFQHLKLTDEQKAKIKEIRRGTRTEVDKILTQQQREQLKTALQNPQEGRRVFDSLNLSDEQKNQLRQVMQSQKTQIDALLSAEQKEELQKYREQMRARRQQRNM
ncbi:P pilus assembly/Cpx signaling pathway, periplasmic inhibitor/zinc-resistance associated protein [Brasilonema sp. UFV-L1]|uniref:Spy/CpxP family protein refolding chaperone n=1 Tax=Brasilonema sp. UFV-L1 TaxID=2234130 RepID=UPI00145DDD54|nr:P pilus assembly/Cpx signaling pathway, periplasmic inhibitor/zinc-resistance associated protein [Brasilonema sp. UFV-L1]NMG11454.1 P pilus assembly/Cpx signaling pathway, periplasmic inhibitor/zinc-resistance associated protein [Brasilonema sp. UFV-L1]